MGTRKVADILGYRKEVIVRAADCLVIYRGITTEHWDRIWTAAGRLAATDWGPELYEAVDWVEDRGIGVLRVERIVPFEPEAPPADPHPPVAEIRSSIHSMVDALHGAGWVHGDLCIHNLGYRLLPATKLGAPGTWEPVMFDYDTMHRPGDGPAPWYAEWVSAETDWDRDAYPDAGDWARRCDRVFWDADWLAAPATADL